MWDTVKRDIQVVFERDPAARSVLEVLLCYPGFHALYFYRLSHWLWERRLFLLGRWASHLGRVLTGIEIHPGARIGKGLFIDHGMGVVIGETSEIGDDVTLYQAVTLGGVSLEKRKRHPTLESRVVVGAGAKILGPITIGHDSRIGANAVVVKDVPPNAVVVGVPGRVTSKDGKRVGGIDLHHEVLPEVVCQALEVLEDRVQALEVEAEALRHGRGEAVPRPYSPSPTMVPDDGQNASLPSSSIDLDHNVLPEAICGSLKTLQERVRVLEAEIGRLRVDSCSEGGPTKC
jgi:serine O-acetyltransferase